MKKRLESAWTRLPACLTLMLLTNGCVNAAVICEETAEARTALAQDLAADGGPRSDVSGAYLIQKLDAGCRG